MDDVLTSAAGTVGAATVLLLLAGQRPAPFAARIVALAPLLIAVGSGWSTAATATTFAIVLATLTMPRRWSPAGAWLFAALLVCFGAYAVSLVRSVVLLASDAASVLLGGVLLVLELGAIGLILASAFEMVDALCSRSISTLAPEEPDRWSIVCLQVPCYNEPPELVIATIRSLVALDYPALRVQVIDNNTTDENLWRPLEQECAHLGALGHAVEFVHLPEWPGYKGGALNWGRTHLGADVEIVGVVDADYVVESGWLRAAIPWFRDPIVAFVQTPQDYREWQGSSFYAACYVGFAYFFRVGMVSRAHHDAIIFAGTMGLIRRSVLDDVGGWDEEIITEDAEISLRVLAQGHRSVYLPVAFGRGIMPLTYEGLRKQRFRWAFGGIQILRRHWRAILGRRSGLTLAQRYDHLIGGLWWFNDALTFGFTLFVGAAAIGAITGRPFVVQRLTPVGIVLPLVLIVVNLVRYLWALRATTGAGPALALAALRVNLSLSWVIALACFRALTQERGVFLRTPKFAGAPAIRELRVVWVEALLGGVLGAMAVAVVVTAGFSVVGLVLTGLLLWPTLIYGSAVGFALGDPKRAPLAHALREKARLEIAPRVGRVARSRPARAGVTVAALGTLALVAALASERDRPAIAGLPFPEAPTGPGVAIRPAPSPSATTAGPSASTRPLASSSSDGSPSAGATNQPTGTDSNPGPTGPVGATPSPTQAPRPTPTPTPTPTAGPSPTPRPTPPVVVPTPPPRPSAPPHPTPAPLQPHPSPPPH